MARELAERVEFAYLVHRNQPSKQNARTPAKRRVGSAGRPRDERATQLILDVTLRHLAQHGYSGLSLDAVSAEAGVTKPMMYRRWASKEDLVTAAVSQWRSRDMPEAVGDFRVDLEANLRQMGDRLSEPLALTMLAALLLREQANPALIKLYRQRAIEPRKAALRTAVLAAMEESALDPTLDVDTVMAMLIGAYYWQVICNEPIPDNWPGEMFRAILKPKRKRRQKQ